MAKYTVKHICGHTQTHELLGPGKERDKKLSWLQTTSCKDCWLASQRETRKAEPVTAELVISPYNGSTFLAVTGGDTYLIKESLKGAGCRWMEYYSNNDLLGINKPRKAWMIEIDPQDADRTAAAVQKLFDAGVVQIRDTTNPLMIALNERLKK